MDSSFSLLGICAAATIGFFAILVTILLLVYRRFKSNRRNETVASSSSPSTDFSTSSSDFEASSKELLLRAVYIYCEETLRYTFASHLSVEFRRKRIAAFVNCDRNPDVTEGSSASVVVFSVNYLSSTSCLDKLVAVLQRWRKTGQLVVPVFYGINSLYVSEWSNGLQELSELPGHQCSKESNECQVVEEIVKDVYKRLFPTEQIGINSRLLEIEQLLCKQPWGIRRIGIWGMPGIGKTTLARAVFDDISGGYEASCFIKHFDEAFSEKGLHRLLEEHFGEILKELPRVCSSITRPSLPGETLSKKRTLVVLDDVKNPLVAESFLGGFHWFAPGSLIIITSSDKQVYRHCKINHVYEVQSLSENEALQLLSQCAFGNDIRDQKRMEVLMEVIYYAKGNPFALSFYSRELKGKKLSEMETTFLKLKLRTPYKIHDLFNSSYKTLDGNEKNIFLDIACFFMGEDIDYVMQLLDGCGFFPHVGIDVLVEKCLVTISENRVIMHRIIQDFGREIINGESVQIERRRRLWEPWTIKFLLEDDKLEANGYPRETCKRPWGTEDIEGIFLDTSNLVFDVKPTAFDNMLNLRFLKIYCSRHENQYGLGLPRGLESLPYELRLLHWENYPLESLPQEFDPCHLVELNMSYSHLQKLWGGTKNLDMLKTCKLCHSQQLTEVDDLSKAQNIEVIDLQGCTKLQRFPVTCQLRHLRVVNLLGCTEIRSIPEISPNIVELHLQGTGTRELPISLVARSQEDELNLEKLTSLAQVVSSNQHLDKLVLLNMKDCFHLQSLPHMSHLESLKFLDLSGCSELKSIQGFPRNLKELYLVGTAVTKLPSLPWSIEVLNAHGCMSLTSIPYGLERLPRYYTFSNCFALSAQAVSEFVVNALANVERIAREHQPELEKSLAFSFTVPSAVSKKITCDMQPGSSVIIQLGSSWRTTLGFAVLVELSFLEDYQEATGFGITCVCRWKDKKFISHRQEKSFHCWNPEEGVPKDHMFVFCDLNMYQSTCGETDPGILADLVVFEFVTVNKQKKPLDESCTVTKCGVHVITAANGDASCSMTQQPFPSSGYLQETSDNKVEEELRVVFDVLDKNDRTLFLYIACLFNDEKADFLTSLVASTGLEISSRLKFLANNSLIHISPFGIITRRHSLLQKISREIVHRQQPMLKKNSTSPAWKYDVFISFSGEDNSNNKISNLLAQFKGKLIMSTPHRCKSVTPELVQAIRESKGSIVLLSKHYASSSRCLDELVEIMNCNKELAQKVVAIFYNVAPSDVRLLSGDFGRAFQITCIGKSEDQKRKWVQALADLANIDGVDSRKWDNEAKLFGKTDCDVLEKMDHKRSKHSGDMVGVEEHVEDIGFWSGWESEEVEKTVGTAGLMTKGEEINASMVAMPVEPSHVFKQEAWSPSFLDRIPFAELYTGEVPTAFLHGLDNIRSMLQSKRSI
ncbi:ADP-ribosyl cyclase/cyclic ADP-ribose hydrolase [Hirschfeldia incana]|nr:ADP-ribosyl cyclase/cyclic ADP-ribose hydrolase [Hirschfeldia incana]